MKKGKDYCRRILSLLLIGAMIISLTPESLYSAPQVKAEQSTDNADSKMTEQEYSTNGCTVEYQVKSTWGNYAAVDLIVKNNGETAAKLSKISFVYGAEINNIWNGSIQDKNDSNGEITYTLKPETYNSLINAGESITIGFIAEGNGEITSPKEVEVSVKRSAIQSENGNATDFGGVCRISTEISNAWDGGIIGKIILENTGDTSVKDWSIHFRWNGTITSMWNAVYEAVNGGYTLRATDYNREIKTGEKIEIGFQATGTESVLEQFGESDFLNQEGTTIAAKSPEITLTPTKTASLVTTENPLETETPTPTKMVLVTKIPQYTEAVEETKTPATIEPYPSLEPTRPSDTTNMPQPTMTISPDIQVTATAVPKETDAFDPVRPTESPATTAIPFPTAGMNTEKPAQNVYVDNYLYLYKDLVCENLYVRGHLYTNGHKIIVHKNLIQEEGGKINSKQSQITVQGDYLFRAGAFVVNKTSVLEVNGSFELSENASFDIDKYNQNGDLILSVGGNLLFCQSSQFEKIPNAKITLHADFKQTEQEQNDDDKIFRYDLYFEADQEQIIQLSENAKWKFRNISLTKAKCVEIPPNIYADTLYNIENMKMINGELAPNAGHIRFNYKDNKDEIVINGNLRLGDCDFWVSQKCDIKGKLILEETNDVYISSTPFKVEGDVIGYDIDCFHVSGHYYNTDLFNLEVQGDILLNGGDFYLDEGNAYCHGNMYLKKKSRLKTSSTRRESLLQLDGDFTIGGSSKVDTGTAQIRIGGDFIQKGDAEEQSISFSWATDITFCGKKKQKILLDQNKSVYWGTLDLTKSQGVIVNDCIYGYMLYGMDKVIFENKLVLSVDYAVSAHDEVIDGDLEIKGGSVLSYSHKLRIQGNVFLKNNAELRSGNELIIEGDVTGFGQIVTCERESEEGYTDGKMLIKGKVELNSGRVYSSVREGCHIQKDLVLNGDSYLMLYDGNVTVDGSVRLNSTNASEFDDGSITLKGDFIQKKKPFQSEKDDWGLRLVMTGDNTQNIYLENSEDERFKMIDMRSASKVNVTGKLRAGKMLGMDAAYPAEGEKLVIELDQYREIEQDEVVHGSLCFLKYDLLLNGHRLKVEGDFTVKSALDVGIYNGDISVQGNAYLDAGRTTFLGDSNDKITLSAKKNFVVRSGSVWLGEYAYVETGSDCVVEGSLYLRYFLRTSPYSIHDTVRMSIGNDLKLLGCNISMFYDGRIEVGGDIIQSDEYKESYVGVYRYFGFIMNGKKEQKIFLPHISGTIGTVDIRESKGVQLQTKLEGERLCGIEKLKAVDGTIYSDFFTNELGKDGVLDGNLECAAGGITLHNKSLTIKGNFRQNYTSTIDNDGKLVVDGNFYAKKASVVIGNKENDASKIHVKGNMYLRKDASVYMSSGYNKELQVDGNLTINTNQTGGYNDNTWWGGKLILGGDLLTGKYALGKYFKRTMVILNGKKPQKIDTRRSGHNFQFLWLDLSQAEQVRFTNPNINATNLLGFDKIKNKAITLRKTNLTLVQNETYNGDLSLIDSTLNMNQHTFHVNGDLEQISTVALLNGGALHTKGYYVIGASVLQMRDPHDLLWVEGDFSMKSTLNHSDQLTKGTVKLKGNFWQGGNECSFDTSDKFVISFIGDQVQKVHFDDEINSHFANVDPANADYQMDDTPWDMTARLSYHIALGIVRGFQEVFGLENQEAFVRNLVACLGVSFVITAIAMPEAAVMIAGEALFMVSGMLSTFMIISAVEGLYDTTIGNESIYQKAEQFSKNSTVLIISAFGAFMSAEKLAETMSGNFSRFEHLLLKQKDQSVGEILETERKYPIQKYEKCEDAIQDMAAYVNGKEVQYYLADTSRCMSDEQWRDYMQMVMECRESVGENLDKEDIKLIVENLDENKNKEDIFEAVKKQKKAQMYMAWSEIKSEAEFNECATAIGKKELSVEERVEQLQELFECSPYKKDITVPSDAKYVRGFDGNGRVIYKWPDKLGFEKPNDITREHPLPEVWDRYGSMTGTNFADIPESGEKYDYSQRAIPYMKNKEAYHTGRFNSETYFDKMDAIRDNDLERLNKILVKENIPVISQVEFNEIKAKYLNFISSTHQQMPKVSAWYGLWGTAAPIMDLDGGAAQYVTPVGGNYLEQLGILKEDL